MRQISLTPRIPKDNPPFAVLLGLVALCLLGPGLAANAEVEGGQPYDPSLVRPGDPEGKQKALDRIAATRDLRDAMAEALTLAVPGYSVTGGSADLILLNRFSRTIDVELSVRSPQGERLSLGFHSVEPLRYLRLPLAKILDGSPAFARGSLAVDFSGDEDMLQGWLVLERGRQVVELPLELLSADTAAERFAFWDLATLPAGVDATPRFYLTNLGARAVMVLVNQDGRIRKRLRIPPGEQRVIEGRTDRSAAWLGIRVPGGAPGLLVQGLLEGEDFLTRLPLVGGAPLSVAADLQALEIPLSTSDARPRRAVAGLFNAGRGPLSATVEVLSRSGRVLAATAPSLMAREVVSVDLDELLAAWGVARPAAARLRIRSDAGGLLANGLTFDPDGVPVEIELIDRRTAHDTGIYPLPSLRENAVLTTLVNLGEEATRVVAQITWPGGEYAFGPVEIDAGAAFRLDLEDTALLKPDLLGRTLDRDYEQAFLQWTVQGPGYHELIGRTQVRPRTGEDSFGFNCSGCCEEYPWGELIPGSLTFGAGGGGLFQACELIGTCTSVLGPYSAFITELNYTNPLSWDGTNASSGSATSQSANFWGLGHAIENEGYGGCFQLAEEIFDSGPVCVIDVIIEEASLPSDHIKVKLDAGGASKSGTLTVTLKDPNTHQVWTGTKAAGTHTIALDRDSLTTGHEYKTVEAKWVVGGQTKTKTASFHFKVLGTYSNTRYNTPTENMCTGANQTVCYTSGGCINATNSYSTTNAKSGFIDEVTENGSGSSIALGFVSREWSFSPPAGMTCHSTDMRAVPAPCPACGGSLVAGSHVAINSGNPNLSCGDRVYVSSEGERTVQDHGGGLSNTQLDHYNGPSGCNRVGGSIGSRKVFKLF